MTKKMFHVSKKNDQPNIYVKNHLIFNNQGPKCNKKSELTCLRM